MTRRARVLLAAAGLLIGVSVFLPLWRIDLIAPQYPEGLGLLIGTNQITGLKEGDLRSINGLNHYIGMAPIVPEAIPELRFMRPLFLGLAVAGLGVAALGRRLPALLWAGAFALLMVGGLADMWRWGYDYGHNLDPHAIIQVPGMSYQPPLIGSKQLLNFRATSWPASGGWLLALAGACTAVALFAPGSRPTQRAADSGAGQGRGGGAA
jgi:hypothetical protein